MSSPDAARRALATVTFNGVDITDDIRSYLLSAVYTDNEEDESDDLQITLQDREDIWLTSWLQEALDAAAETSGGGDGDGESSADYPTVRFGSQGGTVSTMQGYLVELGEVLPVYGVDGYFGSETQAAVKSFQRKNGLSVDGICGPLTWAAILKKVNGSGGGGDGIPKLTITAAFARQNWTEDGSDKTLDCGSFELDSVSCSGPPAVVSLKAVALPFSSQIRQSKLSKAWESYPLSKIAGEMAARNGMTCLYLSDTDPYYARVEQYREADISFLSRLCHDAGISLKATANSLVLFDQAKYEASPSVRTITRDDGSYEKYKMQIGKADTQYASCRVSYVDPATGGCISGTAKVTDYNAKKKDNQQLQVYAKVSSVAEAKKLAQKLLRKKNKFEQTAIFTIPGDPALVAGVTIVLSGWGAWDGKYIIKQAKHTIGGNGYSTQITLRKVLLGETDIVPEAAQKSYKVGDIVNFHGGCHYVSSTAIKAASTKLRAGPAKITLTNPGSAHPWHLIHTDASTGVYGWVDDGSFD